MKVLSIFVHSPQIDLVLLPTVTLLTDELISLTNIIVIIIWSFLQSIICFLAVLCLQFLLLSCFLVGPHLEMFRGYSQHVLWGLLPEILGRRCGVRIERATHRHQPSKGSPTNPCHFSLFFSFYLSFHVDGFP